MPRASRPPKVITFREQLSGNRSFERLLTDALREAGDDPRKYMKGAKTASGFKVAESKNDDARDLLLAHPSAKVKALMQARTALRSWPLHQARVMGLVGQSRVLGGLLPVNLKYYGAHTGRFSGGGGINLQNLGKHAANALIDGIRGLIEAPEGYALIIVDFAQIEARIVSWLAGDETQLMAWRGGRDLYSEVAATIFKCPVWKATNEPPPIRAKLEHMRRIGKICVLGLGYGMGAVRFAEQANCDTVFAKETVATYRATFPKIPDLWYDIEAAFIACGKYGKETSAASARLRFNRRPDCDVAISLPSGRELFYHKVRLGWDGIEVHNALSNKLERVWGGCLTENIVQAIARDVLVEGILTLEKRGVRVVCHVHDEIIVAAKAAAVESEFQTAKTALGLAPQWAPDLPIALEGKVSRSYG